jgi:hypothetical protein
LPEDHWVNSGRSALLGQMGNIKDYTLKKLEELASGKVVEHYQLLYISGGWQCILTDKITEDSYSNITE